MPCSQNVLVPIGLATKFHYQGERVCSVTTSVVKQVTQNFPEKRITIPNSILLQKCANEMQPKLSQVGQTEPLFKASLYAYTYVSAAAVRNTTSCQQDFKGLPGAVVVCVVCQPVPTRGSTTAFELHTSTVIRGAGHIKSCTCMLPNCTIPKKALKGEKRKF